MIVVTYIYRETEGTKRMAASVAKQGYELAVVRAGENPKDIMKALYECYKRAATGHDYLIYADAADTYFQRPVNVPKDYILYSTEKQCFPFPDWANKYRGIGFTPWKYLNNGLMCGPSKLIVEYFERYGLNDIAQNAQAAAMEAYFKAVSDGFPVSLDFMCEEFQSVAFEEPGEFEFDGMLRNLITKTTPAVLHGNGLTPLEPWI